MKQPEYFEKIRSASERRWEQLEDDPELAGPWHQLFKQVQSPRHIISELLQNADDANATEAVVNIENGVFTFEHNGDDFIESHFASICRFGYSNKRALHTIGFRGIGFKSTFSLGDKVYLNTPTLSVAFDNTRFTLPYWADRKHSQSEKTYVSVEIKSEQIESELFKNLKEWLNSPYSLLFFKNIRSLTISGTKVEWKSVGVGPVSNSEWMALDGNLDKPYLVVRSKPQFFPPEALAEIQQERMTGSEEASNEFPPCNIDIVLGAKGRLYVVLPTGVQTELPFACNAPFIQDPARLKIKDPETSPTNQWLLQKAGVLAAEAMMAWLAHQNTNGDAKSLAYDLMPDVDRNETSLEGLCAAMVEIAFEETIDKKPIVLNSENSLISAGEGLFVPKKLLTIWDSPITSQLFEDDARPLISAEISTRNLNKLISWNLIEALSTHKFRERLRESKLPKPSTWKKLVLLWDYLAADIISYKAGNIGNLAIVPVNGQDYLFSSNEVVRLGEKRLVQSEEDWLFLSPFLKVMNQNWTRFITEKKREIDDNVGGLSTQVENASRVLERLQLENTDELGSVLEKVSEKFFLESEIKLSDCIRLTQIYAKLNASVGPSFKYVNEASHFKSIDSNPLRDQSKLLDYLIPEELHEGLLLNESYDTNFVSCSKEEWKDWARSEKSHLSSFVPLTETQTYMYGRKNARETIQKRMGPSDLDYPYVTHGFYFKDWCFPDIYWKHWEKLSATDSRIWFKLLEQIFNQKTGYWRVGRTAKMLQIATTGSTKPITHLPILPNWIMKFRDLECLPDQYGGLNKPKDLFCRTKATEAFLDTELFIPHEMDTDSNRPLLDLLGVQRTPIDGSKLINRLMALAGEKDAPRAELEKWYRRIDQYYHHAGSEERAQIARTFQTEKVILASDGSWQTSKNIFIHGDEDDIPGAPIVITDLMNLTLWTSVGVSTRPSIESAIKWLQSISEEQELAPQDLIRIKNLCAKYPSRVWEDCGKWLNILGEWIGSETLTYSLSMQTLTQTQHLFSDLKTSVADFRNLPMDILNQRPFSELPPLRSAVENRLQNEIHNMGGNSNPEWLHTLGLLMSRILHPKEGLEIHIRNAGVVFSKLVISIVEELRVVPFIDGNPVGTERGVKVFLKEQFLFVNENNEGKRAKLVPNTLGENLPADIKDALTYCYRREAGQISQYMEANFNFVTEGESDFDEAETDSNELSDVDSVLPSEYSQLPSTDCDNRETDVDSFELEVSPLGEEEDLLNKAEGVPHHDQTSGSIKATKPPVKQRPRLFDRYALLANFHKSADGSYKNPNGNWMGATQNRIFPFELRSSDGELLKYYLPREHCLEREPLELNAENWHVIEDKPELYSLILTDLAGNPIVLNGKQLLELREKGDLKIFTAKYRLSYT